MIMMMMTIMMMILMVMIMMLMVIFKVRSTCIALFLFIMNLFGGNLPVIVAPLRHDNDKDHDDDNDMDYDYDNHDD